MKVHVFTREQIEAGIRIKPAYVVISIRNSGEPRAKVKKQAGLRAVLFLAFSGIDPVHGARLERKISYFTPAQADKICAFVHRHKADVGAIVVHCERGTSRSPAVAAAISDALGLDAKLFWETRTPSAYIHRVQSAAFARSAAAQQKENNRE